MEPTNKTQFCKSRINRYYGKITIKRENNKCYRKRNNPNISRLDIKIFTCIMFYGVQFFDSAVRHNTLLVKKKNPLERILKMRVGVYIHNSRGRVISPESL